ncbi:hypothetical protein GILI108418_02845 [Gillisia limnaea]|uniref:Uncharacterized protein n=1 Tax=Gillisia limnaea (strain DSM 15749 / LMG 21470 / R-8282) TaxID=865937 RepID=H2BXB5_GILLR|nr:hypothetical protein Gilli_2479 [Gillisia limnaea DSM 15749]
MEPYRFYFKYQGVVKNTLETLGFLKTFGIFEE